MTQTKKNLIYNILYQILILILPLITVPYVSRTLGAENIGIYSYTYSIVYYFMLIAMLGINNYGNRTIAKSREDKEQLSRNFLGIYSIQVCLSILMIMIYLIYIKIFETQYTLISTIEIIYLIANALDINWFFFGLEKFKLTVTRNIIIKLLSLFLIFIFVKDKNNLAIYVTILAGSNLLSQLLLFPFLKKEIIKVKLTIKDVLKHIKPCLILFVPVIAISIYKVMDKIMIEKLSNVTEVGYYEQAEKITNIPMGIITALGTVMLPKISNLVNKHEEEKIREYIDKSVNFMMFLAFPICFGLIAVADKAIPILLGEEFLNSIDILRLLSTTIIFISFANIIRTQYLIPKEKDRIYIISVFLGAVVNLILNFIFIPIYAAKGACIGTIMAEFIVMLYQVLKTFRELPIKKYLLEIIPFFIKSLIMFGIVYLFGKVNFHNIAILLIQIIVGVIIYGLMNLKYVKGTINIKEILKNYKKDLE